MPRYISAAMGAAEMNLSGSCESRWHPAAGSTASRPSHPRRRNPLRRRLVSRPTLRSGGMSRTAPSSRRAASAPAPMVRRAQMEQRHGAPHHVARPAVPRHAATAGRGGEQVVPRRCDGLRRPGRAGREEQRGRLVRPGRVGIGWRRSTRAPARRSANLRRPAPFSAVSTRSTTSLSRGHAGRRR